MNNPIHHPYSANTVRHTQHDSPIVMSNQPEQHSLVVHSLEDFMLLPLPPRTYLMYPIIPDQGLTLLYAPRGVGKTQLAIMIGLAISSFGVNIHNWRCEQRRGVLFIDGEMQAYSLQERLAAFIKGAGIDPAESLFCAIALTCSRFRI